MLHSLRFRIVLGSLVGFLFASLASLIALNHFLTRDLLDRVDQNLKTQVLEVAASVAKLGDDPTPQKLAQDLEIYGYMHGIGQTFFRLYANNGELRAQSNMDLWPEISANPSLLQGAHIFNFDTQWTTDHPDGIRLIFYRDDVGRVFEIGLDLQETIAILRQARMIIFFAFLGIVAFGGTLGWFLIGRSLKSVSAVSRAAQRITDDLDFSLRVDTPTGSRETDQLASAFNTMLAQIDALVHSQKGIMNNIAHDIRSPVARMRARAEAAIGENDAAGVGGRVIEECDHILNLVNTLLEISETEAGTQVWKIQSLDLAKIVGQAVELFEPVAEAQALKINCRVSEGSVLEADERVLQRLVANLVDNAIKFTDKGGEITLGVSPLEEAIRLEVTDTGRGIPAQDLPHIFDRFYRGDASRSTPGNGLGLSFCAAAVQAMGGTITCDSIEGKGTRFEILLPRKAKHQMHVAPV